MRWQKGRRSQNIEDRRGRSGRKALAGGGIGMIALAVVAMFLGVDPSTVMKVGGGLISGGEQTQPQSAAQTEQSEFVSVILADTEDTWRPIFKQMGRDYREPKLVLFSGSTDSACGYASSAMGPFYCPGDQKVYIDLNFYSELQNKFGAPGDFAQAYVVAHEVGHHVQTLLGISEQVQRAKKNATKVQANEIQVRMELQADCLSGVWANHAHRSRSLLEQGDIEEGLQAAAAIGDDTLQRKAQGYVVPESFTHGSARQRQTWFFRGLESGDINQCDTFSGQI
ncbi:MAG: zinc metallopeptidase [Acidiferrobacterales bacterium]|nr:zinc metallopeptidase [Acidiferrobacterales bacterium]